MLLIETERFWIVNKLIEVEEKEKPQYVLNLHNNISEEKKDKIREYICAWKI